MNQYYKSSLITIPERKINEVTQSIINSFPESQGNYTREMYVLLEAIKRYSDSNLPVDYWFLTMDEEFVGDSILKKKYIEVTSDIEKAYSQGIKICFAGSCGVGKTMTMACILKKAVEVGRSALYTTMSDIIAVSTAKNNDDKNDIRRELLEVDFLFLDEFDQKHIGSSELSSDLFGRLIEPILRTRIQNRLPLILCTNSPKPTSGFQGALKESISSLFSTIQIIPVLGKDYRAKKEK